MSPFGMNDAFMPIAKPAPPRPRRPEALSSSTSASAGIPGYLESYLYSEKLTFRRRNLDTAEVANAALFLLSERSSGINGTTITVDAGLGCNYYDKEIVRLAMRPER
mgnify:CR=1 FL=1